MINKRYIRAEVNVDSAFHVIQNNYLSHNLLNFKITSFFVL